MEAHPAQPSTEQDLDVVEFIDDRVMCTVEQFRLEAATTKLTRVRKDYWRRHLAGAIGALETIRLALK